MNAARCIVNSTEFDPALHGKLPVTDTLTNALLELAWASL